MNYGQRGRELLVELKRSDWIPSYNDEGVRGTLEEIRLHFEELDDQATAFAGLNYSKPPMESRPSMLLHSAAIGRNKQCLLAYHSYRVDKLRALRRETPASLPPSLSTLLSEAEVDFYSEYDKLVSRYSAAIDLDLSAHQSPPEQDLIQVRVIADGLGRIVVGGGGSSVSLDMGTIHFLPRNDVEHLIRQGALEQLDTEESF
mmetsp:Transcript_18334/g.25857  ORF Transcript_18334/g.25857 Transcript_18334/m.25857 type:complete len:202 (+) Transcript_18334:247-852(+)